MLPLFISNCYADNIFENAADIMSIYDVEDSLPQSGREISGKLKIDGTYDSSGALKRLWKSLVSSLVLFLHSEIKNVLELIGIALFSAVSASLTPNKKIQEYINILSCCAAALITVGGVDNMISQSTQILDQMSDYSKAAMPAIFLSAAACGAVVSASAKYAAVCLALDVIMTAARDIVVPLIYAFIALSISESIFENAIIKASARFIKWLATTIMTGITIAFTAYIGFTGLIAGSSDVVAVKTARTVISTSLPIVGGIISDSAAVVLSAASVIKNSAGVFSLIGICALCAGPFAALSVKMLLFRAAAAAADMVPNGNLSPLLNNIGKAMGMLLGLLGSCCIMMFISIMAGIKVVTI